MPENSSNPPCTLVASTKVAEVIFDLASIGTAKLVQNEGFVDLSRF